MSENEERKTGYAASVNYSEDKLEATLTLTFTDEEASMTYDELMAIITENGVICGIKDELVRQISENGSSVANLTIAYGKAPKHGEDAKIDYFFKDRKKPLPKTLDNGAVDLKELGYIETVSVGDILAKKTPVTESEDGLTVTGETIRANPSKDKKLLCGDGCFLSEDELYAIAEFDGIVKTENNVITVSQYVEINHDIGVETGNIKFCGQVVINGNVTEGYKVECDGDMIINGHVEGATLISKGNLIVKKGIHGQWKASIQCDGDLTTTYINGASVQVKGNIDADYILNSMVKCDGKIYAHGKKGIIVGGEIISNTIEAQIVGSDLGVATVIRLGVSNELFMALHSLSKEVDILMDMVNKLKQCLYLLNKRIEKDREDSKSIEMLNEYSEKYKGLTQELGEKEAELYAVRCEIAARKGELKAALIHSDTHVYIGNRNIVIMEDVVKSVVTNERDQIEIKEII